MPLKLKHSILQNLQPKFQYRKYFELKTALISVFVLLGYAFLGHGINRDESFLLTGTYAFLFAVSSLLIIQKKLPFWYLAILGVVVRLLFFDSTPVLSQDFYRFIWDGRLFNAGFNPFLKTPVNFIAHSGADTIHQSNFLVRKMGELSAHHFSNYPPLSQFIYSFSAQIAGKSVSAFILALRGMTLLSDIAILLVGRQFLKKLNLNPKRLFWFFLNPLVILELTGNLHLESFMILPLLMGLYFLYDKKWIVAAVFIALSISVKLLPILLLPLFFWYFLKNFKRPWLKLIGFYGIIAILNAIAFMPFLSKASLLHFADSVNLWFQTFEFNASLYYTARFFGTAVRGYNPIAVIGPALAATTVLIILRMAFFRKQKNKFPFSALLLGFAVYLLLTTTVHPWYLTTPLLLSIFTRFKFLRLWSLTIILSYAAYATSEVNEQTWTLALEYIPVYSLLIVEMIRFYRSKKFRYN